MVQPLSHAPFAWAESSLEQVLLVSLTPVPSEGAPKPDPKPSAATWPPPARASLQLGWKSKDTKHDGKGHERRPSLEDREVKEREKAFAEKQPVRLDEMMKSVHLHVSGGSGGGKEKDGGAKESAKDGAGSGTVWAHVGMQGGVRVLTLSMDRVEPPSVAGEDEPHTYFGLFFGGVGVSIVHAVSVAGVASTSYLSPPH